MKGAKFVSILILLVILILLLIVALWCVLLPEDVKDALGSERWRRKSELKPPQSPEWMRQKVERTHNRSRAFFAERVLFNALGNLEISGPEDVMTYITLDSCKNLKRFVDTFERYWDSLFEENLSVRLSKAIRNFHSIYCGRDERYRKLFSQWQDELLGLHEQFVDCEGAPDWFENTNATNRCSEANNVMNCVGATLEMEIGSQAAKAWKCLFRAVVNEAMIHPCSFTHSRSDFPFDDGSIAVSSEANAIIIALCIIASAFIF